MPEKQTEFNLDCRQCSRLSDFLDDVKIQYPEYHARPVAPFGTKKPELLIVGLAPGMHGANASGRPFTGDYAGILLYQALYKFGFSNKPESISQSDGLKLKKCRITNAVKCLPPENKPTGSEIKTCNQYLKTEISTIKPRVILALGKIAHDSVLRANDIPLSKLKFAHNVTHVLSPKMLLIDSYHCSRYNTSTRRLTEQMFFDVFANIQEKLNTDL